MKIQKYSFLHIQSQSLMKEIKSDRGLNMEKQVMCFFSSLNTQPIKWDAAPLIENLIQDFFNQTLFEPQYSALQKEKMISLFRTKEYKSKYTVHLLYEKNNCHFVYLYRQIRNSRRQTFLRSYLMLTCLGEGCYVLAFQKIKMKILAKSFSTATNARQYNKLVNLKDDRTNLIAILSKIKC